MGFRGRGGDGIRTRVYGFAGRCLATRPLHRMWISKTSPTRADDEIRTRDPHLGKVMRYHCATSAFHARSHGRLTTLTDPLPRHQTERRVLQSWRVPSAKGAERSPRCGKIGSRGRLAQLVARFLHTEEVIGSSPVSPTRTPRPGAPFVPMQRPRDQAATTQVGT